MLVRSREKGSQEQYENERCRKYKVNMCHGAGVGLPGEAHYCKSLTGTRCIETRVI